MNPLTDIKVKNNKATITVGGVDDIKAERNTLNQAAKSILPAELQKINEVILNYVIYFNQTILDARRACSSRTTSSKT